MVRKPIETWCFALVVVRQDDRFLVIRELKHGQRWYLPAGRVEPGEDFFVAAKREAEEEAGLMDLKIIAGFKELVSYFYKRDGKSIAKEVVFFLAESQTEDIKLSTEHTEYKWMEFDKALKQVTFKTSKDVLKKADKFIKKQASQTTL